MPSNLRPCDDSERSLHPAREGSSERLRVLVVEDGRNAADILAMFFEIEGYEVGVAYDGHDGVAKAASLKPHLVLMDIGMPRMNGLEAARRIRNQEGGANIVIVALSGLDEEEDKRRCEEAGLDGHLAKPVGPKELREVMERFRKRFEGTTGY